MPDIEQLILTLPNYNPHDQAEGCWFDKDAALKVIYFIENYIIHVEDPVAGEPFILSDWMKAFVGNLFGWKRTHPKFGTVRRYNEALLQVPRKNCKSTLAAAIELYNLCADGVIGGQVVCAATDANQAEIIFNLAKRMITMGPLNGKIKLYKKTFVHEKSQSTFKILSGKPEGKHGFNINCGVIDELHEQPSRQLMDFLSSSRGARKESLMLYTTTADFQKPSVANDVYKMAKNICANKGNKNQVGYLPQFLPAIWEADQNDDWTKVETWAKANPNWGISVHEDKLKEEYQRAIEQPAFENEFKRLYLNLRTSTSVKALDMNDYDLNIKKEITLESLKGQSCHAGLDLSSRNDTTSLVLFFPATNSVLPFFWVPESNAAQREKKDKVPYSLWHKQGFLEMTPGNEVDYSWILRKIIELSKVYKLDSIGYDPWEATAPAQELQSQHGFKMFQYRQGFISMNEPSKRFNVMFNRHELNFIENPVMRWQCGNLMWDTQPPENIKPSKEHSTEKIDGAVSLIMAIGRSMLTTPFKSVYSDRGVVFI